MDSFVDNEGNGAILLQVLQLSEVKEVPASCTIPRSSDAETTSLLNRLLRATFCVFLKHTSCLSDAIKFVESGSAAQFLSLVEGFLFFFQFLSLLFCFVVGFSFHCSPIVSWISLFSDFSAKIFITIRRFERYQQYSSVSHAPWNSSTCMEKNTNSLSSTFSVETGAPSKRRR